MKKTLILFVLLSVSFSSHFSNAEDLSDFQIEGMSIGDSLLDYFSEREIKENIVHVYDYIENKKFTSVGFNKLQTFKTYEVVQIEIKIDDNIYKIYGIGGIIHDRKIVDNCYENQDEIAIKMSAIFNDVEKEGPIILNHPADPSNESKVRSINFFFYNGDVASVDCFEWSKKMPYEDDLSVTIVSKEFNEWVY